LQVGRSSIRLRRQSGFSNSFFEWQGDEDLDQWPRSKNNTVINVCSQGQRMIIERFGKLHTIANPGWFLAIPGIDDIRFVIDMREKSLLIPPQACITNDNVAVQVSGNLYCQFIEPERAAYGSKNPIYAVKQHAQSSMRAAIGEMELDQILRARSELNDIIRTTVQEAATAWGIEIKRYEITEVQPDKNTLDAMGRQAAAERERRSTVLEAEGKKKAAELESEGDKVRLVNQSEGRRIQVENESEASKFKIETEAKGNAQSIRLLASAQAQAITEISSALSSDEARDAAKLQIANKYIDMYSDIGQKSNTMIFNDRPADVNALLAQAGSVLQANNANKK
jgi:regulator of protease activity HflC (stomatin/prohibitin superfamily)